MVDVYRIQTDLSTGHGKCLAKLILTLIREFIRNVNSTNYLWICFVLKHSFIRYCATEKSISLKSGESA